MAFFSPGDLLLKVDMRAVAETKLTKHHVMLVLGESKRGFPIVIHMKGEPHWTLVEEELNHGKDLILLQPKWSEQTALLIVAIARKAHSSKKFILTKQVIDEQRQQISPYRPDGSIDAATKFNKLKSLFNEQATVKFNPDPKAETIISCHEWVLSMIHYACAKTQTLIPKPLRIPPHLAWADRLAYAAEQSDEMPPVELSLSTCYVKEIRRHSSIPFFPPPPPSALLPKPEEKAWGCPIQ